MRVLARVTTGTAAAMLLAACTSGPTAPTPGETTLPGCDKVACSGTLAGAAYQILLPQHWNGTLLLYSHGYRPAAPVPPDFAPVQTSPEPEPGWAEGQHAIGDALLAKGYALAGSAFAANGWAVQEGMSAAEGLYAYFRDNVAVPQRVYAWGDSLGGLITAELAEAHPDWVSGAAPTCGVLAGLNPNLDLELDVAYAVRTLLWSGLKLTGYTSYEDAVRNLQGAAERVLAAARAGPAGEATVLFIAALVDAPAQTQRSDAATAQHRLDAATEGVLTALGFGTYARYDIENRVGGNPSSNSDTDYPARISAADRARIDAVDPGATARLLAKLTAGPRVAADPSARAAAARLGDPQGDLRVPMITLHDLDDPLVLSANESWYAARVASHGESGNLRQYLTVPPKRYPPGADAPYGAGHCNFTPASRVGLVTLLDDWVRTGRAPDAAAVTAGLGAGSGVEPSVVAPPWPAGGDKPTSG